MFLIGWLRMSRGGEGGGGMGRSENGMVRGGGEGVRGWKGIPELGTGDECHVVDSVIGPAIQG